MDDNRVMALQLANSFAGAENTGPHNVVSRAEVYLKFLSPPAPDATAAVVAEKIEADRAQIQSHVEMEAAAQAAAAAAIPAQGA